MHKKRTKKHLLETKYVKEKSGFAITYPLRCRLGAFIESEVLIQN